MKAIQFKEQNQTVRSPEKKYPDTPIKVIVDGSKTPVYSKWKPSKEDLERLNNDGAIWLVQHTAGEPMQRTYLQTETPDFEQLEILAEEETKKILQHLSEKMKHNRKGIDPEKVDYKKLRKQLKGGKK